MGVVLDLSEIGSIVVWDKSENGSSLGIVLEREYCGSRSILGLGVLWA